MSCSPNILRLPRITPPRGPPRRPRATIITSASGNLRDEFRRVAQHHQRFLARQIDRIEKPLIR
jgi:hypothetical protein